MRSGISYRVPRFGLFFQAAHLAEYFLDDIADPIEVLPGGIHLPKGFYLAVLVPGHPGRLLDEKPPFFRIRIGDGTDISLLNDRIGPGPHAASQKHVVNILEAAGLLVDIEAGLPGSVEPSGDVDLGKVPEFLRRAAVVVGKGQGDLGHVYRRPCRWCRQR